MTDYHRPPFLERLFESGTSRRVDRRLSFNREEVLDSILQELRKLLNTRSPSRRERDDDEPLTACEYGLADLLQYYPYDPAAREELGIRISRAIEVFEPRLCLVNARVYPTDTIPRRCRVEIEASLKLESVRRPVFFSLVAGHSVG